MAPSVTIPGNGPEPPIAKRRRRRRWPLVALALLGLLFALTYTAPVQQWTFGRVSTWLTQRAGIVVTAGEVDFDPITLRASLGRVSIASRATPGTPYFVASHVDITATAAVLRGRPVLERIRVVDATLDQARVAPGKPGGDPFRGLGSLQLGEVSVENFTYLVGGPDTARVAIRKVSLRGAGTAPGRLRLESVSPASLVFEMAGARLPFNEITASFVMAGDRLIVERLRARSDTATVEGRGTARFDRGYPIDLDYRASIDLARAGGWWNLTPTTVKGRAEVSGRVTGPFLSPTATAAADARGFAWSALSPGRLTASGVITGPGIRLDTFTLAVPEVTARGTGFLSWEDAGPRSAIDAAWRAPLLRRLGPLVELEPSTIPLVASDGSMAVDWKGFIPDLATMAGSIRTRLASSHPDRDDRGLVTMAGADTKWRVNWQQWLPGDTSAHGQLAVRIDPEVFARSALTGTLDVSVGNAAPAIARAAFLDISVPESALTRLEAGRAALTGPLGGTVAMPVWHATLEAGDIVLSGLRDITVTGPFVVDPDWFTTEGLQVRAPGSALTMHGRVGVLQEESDLLFDGVVGGAWASAPFAPPEWPIAGEVSIRGRWITDSDRDDLEVEFESKAAALAGHPLGPVQGRVLSGLAAATGELAIPELGSRLSGTYDLTEAQAHSVRGTFANVDLARWLTIGGADPAMLADVRLTLDGTAEASGPLDSLETLVGHVVVGRLSGEIHGRPVALTNPTTLHWTRGALSISPATVTAGSATFALTTPAADPEATTVTMAAPISEVLALLPAGSVPAGISVDGGLRVDVRVPSANPRNLSARATARVASVAREETTLASGILVEARLDGSGLEVPTMTGTVMGASLRASAAAPSAWVAPWLTVTRATGPGPAGPAGARLWATIDVPLGETLNELGYGTPELNGTARVVAELTADRPTIEAVRGLVTAESLVLQTRSGAYAEDGPGHVRIEGGRATIESLAVKGPDSRVALSGWVDLTPGGQVDLHLSGSSAMTILDALVAPRVSGHVDLELHAGGSLAHPDLDGFVSLRKVSAVSPASRLVLADFDGRVAFRPGLVESVDLEGQINGGTVRLSGSLPLDASHGTGRLRAEARDVFLEYPPGFRNRISATLTLVGGLGAPALQGEAVLLSEPYRESLPSMAQMLRALSNASGMEAADSPGLLDRVALDVSVSSSMPMKLDNSLGRVELIPRVRLVGTVGRPGLAGPVAILDGGRVYLQSRTYTLTDSRMDFDPEEGFVPRLQVVGATRIGEYDVTLRILGPVDAIEMSLSSMPPLAERELRGLILTGQVEDGSGARSSKSDQFALTALSSDLIGVAGQALGFDSVRIGSESFELVSSDVDPTTRLTISKTFLDRFEFIYSDNLDDNTATWIVVYRPRSNIEFRASSRDNLTNAFEFRQRLSFGPATPPKADETGAVRAAPALARREVVDRIIFDGAPAGTEAGLRALLKMRPGQVFDYGEWMRDHDRLSRFYADTGYLTARIVPTRTTTPAPGASADRVSLSYRIARGPATALFVTGIVPDAEMVRRLRTAWGSTTFDAFAADDISRAARKVLFERGHVVPVVETAIRETPQGALIAEVSVSAGPRPKTRSVEFVGMKAFSDLALRNAAAATETLDKAWADPDALCFAITRTYAEAGYRKASVKAEPVEIDGESAVRRFRIEDGPPTLVGTVQVTGVGEERLAAAREAVNLAPGALLAAGAERAARVRLERHFRNLGFRNASVTVATAAPDANGRVDVSFAVTEGRLRVVRDIRVDGLRTTNRSLVDRAVVLEPGAPAGQGLVTESVRRLYGLGVFSGADIRLEPAARKPGDPAGDVVPVNAIVSVTEPPRFQFVYGIEFTNEYGPVIEDFENAAGFAADVRDRNVLGRGMSWSVGGRYDPGLRSVRSLFGVPTLSTLPVRTNVFLSWSDENVYSEEDGTINERTRSGSLEQRWRPRPSLDLSWSYSLVSRTLTVDSLRDFSNVRTDGVLASLNGAVILDHRDNVLNTTRGWFNSVSLQQGMPGLGSDYGYSRILVRTFGFVPFWRVVSASAVRVGSIWNTKGAPPIDTLDLLFQAGGSQTVRGYSQDGLSAASINGLPIGGTRLLVLNQELRVTVSKWLQAVVFADAGNTFIQEGISLKGLAVGLGGGIRIMTPLAPLRIDMGFPVPRRPGDPLYRWHVSVGHIF